MWSRGGMRVIDWEFFRRRSLPLFDLFMLAVHPGVALKKDGGALLDEFVGCFEKSPFSIQVRDSIQTLSQKLRLDKETIPVLFLVFLLSLSNQRDTVRDGEDREIGSTWRACLRHFAAYPEQLFVLSQRER